jgi:type IX secretion system PorP/SprF family membrane protein
MKRILLILFLLSVIVAKAQYIPNSGQAFQFASLYNPAFTGVESFNDLKLGYRYQWTGFKEYAPKFVNLTYNFRLKQPLDLTLNSLRGSRDAANEIPNRKKVVHGLGFNIYNEKVGLLDRIGGGVNFAIHYPLSKSVKFAGALNAMIENTKLNVNEIYLGKEADADPFYDNLMKGSSNHTEVRVRAGALLYGNNFYLGLTYYPILTTTVQTTALNFDNTYYKGSFQAGLSFPVGADSYIKPSIWGLMTSNNKLLIDYSAKLYLQNKVWFGLTYRDIQSGVLGLGFNINNLFSAAYAYEFSTGRMKNFNGGSHELVLSVRLNNFKRLNQYTW